MEGRFIVEIKIKFVEKDWERFVIKIIERNGVENEAIGEIVVVGEEIVGKIIKGVNL